MRLWTLLLSLLLIYVYLALILSDRLIGRVTRTTLAFEDGFLSSAGFPKEGRADLVAVAIAGITFSMSCLSRRYFHERACCKFVTPSFFTSVLPFVAGRNRACRLRYETYSGRAAILSRETARRLPLVPSHRAFGRFVCRLIARPYRFALLPEGSRLHCRRSRTFTGQCCQPFCSGDATCHV